MFSLVNESGLVAAKAEGHSRRVVRSFHYRAWPPIPAGLMPVAMPVQPRPRFDAGARRDPMRHDGGPPPGGRPIEKGDHPPRSPPFSQCPIKEHCPAIMPYDNVSPTPSPLFDGRAARDFLAALDVDPATVHYRGIHWDKEKPYHERGRHLPPSAEPQSPRLEALQQQGYRLYWLPNGGPKDEHITTCRFLFVEWDDNTVEWQLQAWRQYGLPEPTVMLATGGKSIHCYWRLSAPIVPDRWRVIIARLIHHCKSDPSCCNPSRLMRLAGSSYIYKTGDKDAEGNDAAGTIGPAPATVITASGKAYEAEWFEQFLPQLPPPEPIPSRDATLPLPLSIPDANRKPTDPRSYAELERLVAAYPEIRKDNDQYHEAVKFIFGLCMAMEEAGYSRGDAIALASRYHPGAADTFEDARKADIKKSQGGSFIKMVRSAGVDVTRRDINRREEIDIPPDAQFDRPEATSASVESWEIAARSLDDADREAIEAAAEELIRAGREPITIRDILPDGLAIPLIERAEAFPCDPMALVLPLLTSTASVVGNRVEVRVRNTWKEPFILWAANIMPASSLKSPIANVMLKALGKWQVELNKAHKQEKAVWATNRNRIAMEVDKDGLKQWDADNPPPPPGRELFIVDATLEKIGQILGQDSTPGMVAFHDELSLWFAQLKRGKDAMDQRSNWLSLWTGGLLKVDRVGRESIYVASTSQSVFGLATVDGLANIRAGKQTNGNQDADGMWARFLLWQPMDVPFDDNDLDRDITDLLCNLFRDRIDAKLPFQVDDGPLALNLGQAAIAFMRPHWKAWDRESRATTAERGQWLGKLRGHSVRLAGILQMLDSATKELGLLNEVTIDTATRAVRLCYALLDQYDLLCPKIGGDTGDLDPAVAKLLANGIDWQREHGAAPVPAERIRWWRLPARESTAKERRDWLESVCLASDGVGTFVKTSRSFEWIPPC